MKFRMLWDHRLDKYSRFVGIKPCGNKIHQQVCRTVLYRGRIGIARGESMPISNKIEAVELVLKAYPVLKGADKVAEVQLSARLHAAQNALFSHRISNSNYTIPTRLRSSFIKGVITTLAIPLTTSTRTMIIPKGSTLPNKCAWLSDRNPISTLPPSSGGIGIKLNAARTIFICMLALSIIPIGL